MIDDREVRDRIDRGPLAEAKGREHWILHLLLRAQEFGQGQLTTLIGSAYSNLTARLQTIEDRVQHVEGSVEGLDQEVKTRLDGLGTSLAEQVSKEVDAAFERLDQKLNAALAENLDTKWKPVGDSVETFARSSHQLTKDLSDTYRVATQTRLLLNENSRRMIDLGRDIVALEESLKLALTKVLEEGLQSLDDRIASLESRMGPAEGTAENHAASEPPGSG